MTKNICHVTTVHSVFDDRIFLKECRTLAKEGYSVSLIARHDKEETVDNVRIVPLPEYDSRWKRFTVIMVSALFHALREDAEIYHFHDPELIPIGLILKIVKGKKVIYDVHEDYGKQILHKEWLGFPMVRKLVAHAIDRVEKWSSGLYDKVICATSDIAQKFPSKKSISIRNLAVLKVIDSEEPAPISDETKIVVIYAGHLAKKRGIVELIDAIEILDGSAELWLLGGWQDDSFRSLCERREGWQFTRYIGFKPVHEVYRYMKSATIGVATLYPLENYITSLPVKVFEYMACSLPVIISDFAYWRTMFDEGALFVDPLKPGDIAERIMYLIENTEKRTEMGAKARELIEERYSWEREEKILCGVYTDLIGE